MLPKSEPRPQQVPATKSWYSICTRHDFQGGVSACYMDKATHLTAFYAWIAVPMHLLVIQADAVDECTIKVLSKRPPVQWATLSLPVLCGSLSVHGYMVLMIIS